MTDNYFTDVIPSDEDITTPGFNRISTPDSEKEKARKKAQKEEKRQKREKTEKNGIFSFFADKRFSIVMGIIMILVTAYLALSAFSYIFHGAADQSEVEGQTLEQIVANPDSNIRNIGGPGGALFSHRFLTLGLGLGTIPVFIYFILIGLALLKVRKCQFWSMTFKTLLLAVTISVVLGLVFYTSDLVIPPGGYHGHYLNMLIMERFSWIGAAALSLALIGCVVGVYFYDLQKLYSAYRKKIQARNEKRRELKLKLQDSGTKVEKIIQDTDHPTPIQQQAYTDIISSTGDDYLDPSIEPTPVEQESITEKIEEEERNDSIQNENIEEKVTVEAGPESIPDVTVTITKGIESSDETQPDVFDPTAELSRFKMPTVELLREAPTNVENVDMIEIEDKKNQIIDALGKLKIGISKIDAIVGPTVTMYEIVPAEGVKIATIKRLEEDIALALAALSTRIIAPIPGKSAIGIEVPNRQPQMVFASTIFGSKAFSDCNYELPIALGATIDNKVYIADLAKMPHLLVAGATGKGKSVGMNVIINSLLFKKHPAELKFVLVDPKMVEFYPYRKLEKHYLAQVPDAEEAVITDTTKVISTLKSLVVEMENRYRLLKQAEVVKITDYNKKFINKKLNPNDGHRFLPYIVVVVDEYADLVMSAGKEIETPIARLAQKARAVGMHVIIATQRPSANIITGIIKANFPARIAFKVANKIDGKIILDNSGPYQLVGNGDMLISNDSEISRVQCAFISTDEIIGVANFINDQPGFPTPFLLPEPEMGGEGVSGDFNGGGGGNPWERDPLFEEVARFVIASGVASTSGVQRRYSIGYNRAGKIMDQMEAAGMVGPSKGGKPRDILIDAFRLEEILGN